MKKFEVALIIVVLCIAVTSVCVGTAYSAWVINEPTSVDKDVHLGSLNVKKLNINGASVNLSGNALITSLCFDSANQIRRNQHCNSRRPSRVQNGRHQSNPGQCGCRSYFCFWPQKYPSSRS